MGVERAAEGVQNIECIESFRSKILAYQLFELNQIFRFDQII
jgi:hypothetical protein